MFDFLKGGKAELRLDKLDFRTGEKITGNVKFDLKKVVKAREARIEFYGERTERRRNRNGEMTSNTVRVYEFKLLLDTEKEYSGVFDYPFGITIPGGLFARAPLPEGAVGAVLGTLQALAGPSIPKWYVKAVLDIPGGMDISKTVQVNIA